MGKCLLEDVIELLVSEKFHLNSKSYAVNIIVHFGKKGRKEGKMYVNMNLKRFTGTFLTLR